MVIEGILKTVKPKPGKYGGTLEYIGNGARVITNEAGKVTTVIPN